MNSKFNIGDTVKIIEDEILDGALDYEKVNYKELYTITAINDYHGISHHTLKSVTTNKFVFYSEIIPYGFIEVEIEHYKDNELSNEKINALEEALENGETIEFKYNGLFYEIFESVSSEGYIINVYSSDEKNEDGFLEENLIDGGLCSGGAEDAILFML